MDVPPRGSLLFLPHPRHVTWLPGTCASNQVAETIDAHAAPPQGYRLTISPAGTIITAADSAGAFYARQTLRQLQAQCGHLLPCLHIEDHPDFPVRGVMLDISRDKVPTQKTLLEMVDRLAAWKINQLQLYTEHTFAYRGHEAVWKNASPMTADEVIQLDEHCRQRFIELVPNQNSFGHMERWLGHPRYQHLAEAIDGSQTPWGYRWKGPFSLCPTDPASVDLLADLYNQLLPCFTSRLFNVGCDETFDIGQGRSREQAAEKGSTRIYLDFLHKVHALLAQHGRTMMCWGDIIIQQPPLIAALPKPIIALEWGYEADHPFDADGRHFAESGIPFYVCPGTSSWLSIAGRTDNMLANQLSAAENGLRHGACGYLNTDWGDHGHLQYLPVSYAGFAVGAAFSWCLQTNRDLNLAEVLDRHALPGLGKMACDLGNVYQAVGRSWPNSSALFRILVPSSTHKDPMEGLTNDNLQTGLAAISRVGAGRHASLESDEFTNAAALLAHACRRGLWKLNPTKHQATNLTDELPPIIAEHRRLWLTRNRPGGLSDSTARLESCLQEYKNGFVATNGHE